MSKTPTGARRLPTNARKLPPAQVVLIRFWEEARDDPETRSIWRGTISDLQGQNLGCFGIAEELFQYLVREPKTRTEPRR